MASTLKTDRDSLQTNLFARSDNTPANWVIADELLPYPDAVEMMEKTVAGIRNAGQSERVWLVEHPPLFTAGTSADTSDLLKESFPVFKTGRGGEYTYHGPGQRVCYVMLDLALRKQDVRAYVATLEQWVINTLDQFNIKGERREDRVGVWVARPDKPASPDGTQREDKIAAIGIRLRKWVTYHGISINVEPDLTHYDGIVPCGIQGHGVTSLVDLGLPVSMTDLDMVLKQEFEKLFGPVL